MSLGAPTPIEVAVSGPSLAADRAFAEKVKGKLQYIPALRDVQFGQALDYPTVDVGVDRERCIGCGQCVARAPQGTFHMDQTEKAVGPAEPQEWSPVDGGFIRHCPTYAITARPAAPAAGGPTSDGSRGTAPAPA